MEATLKDIKRQLIYFSLDSRVKESLCSSYSFLLLWLKMFCQAVVISHWLKIKLVEWLKKPEASYMKEGTPPSSPLSYSQSLRAKERLHISSTIYSLELGAVSQSEGNNRI